MSLSGFDPKSYRLFVWGYSWPELRDFYIQKNKEYAERTNAFCSFLVELVSAAVGGGKKDDEIGLDNGDLGDISDENLAEMRLMLGEEDFRRMYPDYVDD